MLPNNQHHALLYLHRDVNQVSWVTDEETVICGDPNLLQRIAIQYRWTIVVPAEEVVLTTVHLPKMKPAQLRLALPFALEEQLIDEVEYYHFAISDKPQDPLSVAVVSHDKMSAWQTLWRAWQIMPHQLLPLSLALPYDNNSWTVVVDELITMRTSFMQGFTCDADHLPYYLQQLNCEQMKPQRVELINPSSLPFSTLFKQYLNSEIEERIISYQDYLQRLWKNTATPSDMNLLQQTYVEKTQVFFNLRRYGRSLIYAGIALFISMFVFPGVSYFILTWQANQLAKKIQQLYTEQFPQAKQMVAPLLRLQNKLQQLQAGAANPLLLLLAQMAETRQPNVKISHLDYDNAGLMVKLTANSVDDLTHYMQSLNANGLIVKQQNTNLIDNGVNAIWIIHT